MKSKLKFKKLLNEYKSLKYEEQYIKEVLRDSHQDFDEYYRKFCQENEVSIASLEKDNKDKVTKAFEESKQSEIKGIDEKIRAKDYDYKKIFKQIARKLHPDKLSDDDPRLSEFEDDFKKAANGINNGHWGDLFDVADKHEIDIEDYEMVNKSIKDSIDVMKKQIASLKNQYSYMFYECEEDKNCKDSVIKSFIKQLFGVKI